MNIRRVVMGLCVMVLLVATATSGEEKKPMSNADVVTMINAGLSENTIIMAIKQGSAEFDTSASALIELKNQGATSGMLEAMMQSTESPTSTGNALLDAYNKQISGGTQMSSGDQDGILLIDETNTVKMKYATMQSQGKVSFAPFAPTKVYSKLEGQRSACRISSYKPRFEFSMSRNVQPTTRVALIAFAVRGQTRIIQSLSSSMAGMSRGFPKERIIEMKITEIKSDGNAMASRQIRYVATPIGALVPGEYALVFDGCMAYDFGINAP